MIDGVIYLTAARSRLGDRRAHRPRALALRLGIQGRHPHRQPRRGRRRRLALLRNARLPPRLARHQGRQGALAQGDLRSRSVLLRLGRAGGGQGPRHRRRQRRRPRHPGLRPVARSGERRDAVALVRRAAEEGRARLRDVAERGRHEARRRHDVAADHLRPRSEPDLRDDRQPAAGHRAQEPRGRQPLHRLDRRAESRHRQDGVGTSSRRRTIRTTGTRRRRRC